jgi:hypothetical protein
MKNEPSLLSHPLDPASRSAQESKQQKESDDKAKWPSRLSFGLLLIKKFVFNTEIVN